MRGSNRGGREEWRGMGRGEIFEVYEYICADVCLLFLLITIF